MVTLILSCSCPSELTNIVAITASDEGQLALVANDGVFILVSCKIIFGVTMPPNYFGGEIGKMSMPTNYC